MEEVTYLARKRFSTFRSYVTDLFKAHYNVAGKYTFPVNSEVAPLHVSEFNILAQVLLSPFVLLPAWLCSLIVLPLFGNGALSFINLAKRVIKIALVDTEESKEINTEDERSLIQKLYGLPCAAIGFVGSLLVSVFIVLGRAFINSLETFVRTVRVMTNAALAPSDEFEHLPDTRVNEDKTPAKKLIYGFGSPGAGLGLVIGALSWGTVIAGRAISNTLKSAKGTIVTMTRFALGKSLSDKLIGKGFDTTLVSDECGVPVEQGDTRSNRAKFGIGLAGAFIIGPIIGLIPLIAIAIGRTIGNSALTFLHTLRTMVNAALIKYKRYANEDGTPFQDTRSDHIYYGLGSLGLVFGVMIGSVAALVAASVESGKRLLSNMLSAVLNPEDKHWVAIAKVDDRHRAVKYLLGLPGGVVVFFPAAIGMFLLGAARIATNTAKTTVATFVTLANFVLSKKDFYPHLALQTDKTRSLGLIILGGAGFILSGVAVLLAGTVYLLKHIVVQTKKSWVALSGSIMNVALGDHEFSGLAGDEKRSVINKAFGFLGYVASVLITPIIGLIVFVVRNPIDTLARIGTVVVSPITAVIKPVYKAVKGHRFDGVAENNIIKAFKNLYSSLTASGQFDETIKDGKTGKKGPLAFIRKAFTVSVNTRTEHVLNKLLKAYKKDPEVFNDDEKFNARIKKVEEVYSAEQKKSEVKQIADFVREYVNDYQPDTKVKPELEKIYASKSLRSTFWGKPREVLPVTAPVIENDGTNSPRKDK